MRRAIFIGLMLGVGWLGWQPAAHSQIAIIANKKCSVDNLTLEELRLVYLGQITTFRDRRDIILAVYKPLHDVFLKKVVKLSPYRYRKHWIRLIFTGHGSAPPEQFEDPKLLKQFVQKNECSIAFVHFHDVDDSVKVLRIDGKLPTEKGYPLR